ncbi:MAG: HDIG domain-containing protein [Opitutus sp.]|nr:HDIG domain-containing protein [Opitutus sp.]MCS6248432.1 HDIG domain-containing protein [Opitutus sp.]MCS6274575.1 HDIG domain-containing protein [Opitutus sp.]MCS6277095.1 HDIG domain-containing protein [Opitutus sp.]MCS6300217.1 HDIG domain-containing protein [Opitutus sp.]
MIPFLAKLIEGNQPRTRKTATVSGTVEFLETNRLVTLLIFAATAAAIATISFVGISSATLPVLPNQVANIRILASAPFSYPSAEKTRLAGEHIRDRLPPIYRLDLDALIQFQGHMRELVTLMDEFERTHPTGAVLPAKRKDDFAALVATFNALGPYQVSVPDLAILFAAGPSATRAALVETGLRVLSEIHHEGIQDVRTLGVEGAEMLTVSQIVNADGSIARHASVSVEQAFNTLRINLGVETGGRDLGLPLYRIFRNGITANLIFDHAATRRLQEKALRDIKPVIVEVARGQTLIEPGVRVTAEQYEMLTAHRQYLLAHGDISLEENMQLFGRVLLVLAMLVASIFYIRIEDPETLRSNGRLALLALVVIFNLALVRASYALGSLPFFVNDSVAGSLLPYFAPVAIAPLIVAILINAGSAIFMALFVSIFTSLIYGNRLDLLVLTFLSSVVAIFWGSHTRKRGNVVRASSFAGLTVAVFALLIGVIDRLEALTIAKHMVAGLATGLLTGVVVVGLLPVLEGLFKRTTDITLLELTDYNHPLLRLMQLEAPGTYHHSLVVAQLAENAAAEIGANPLLARVCALFHDIGKTEKPEYFTENQRDGVNPHDSSNPSLSALIIKSHVKDGVDIAIKHKLPRAVIDVISQHHGTSLIRYFYNRAVSHTRQSGTTAHTASNPSRDPFTSTAPGLDAVPVCETTYRYDGPRPRFKESAIIHLADGVEAASRSLRKVTPQHLGEIIDQIFHHRIEDGQLDEAPITFDELSRIKTSFTFTLLNMLHGRVTYPAAEEPGEVQRTK